MSQSGDYDIVLAGGGLVGSALANALLPIVQSNGWRLALVDAAHPAMATQASHPQRSNQQHQKRNPQPAQSFRSHAQHPSFDERSTALSFGSQQWLERLGIWTELAKYAGAIQRIWVGSKGQWGKTRLKATDQGVPALGWVVGNRALGQALWQPLLSAHSEHLTLFLGDPLVAVQPSQQGYHLQLQQAGNIHAKLLIVTDGYPSFCCQKLGIQHSVQAYNQQALITNIQWQYPHQGVAYERFTPSGALALLPLREGNKTALVYCAEASVNTKEVQISKSSLRADSTPKTSSRAAPAPKTSSRAAIAPTTHSHSWLKTEIHRTIGFPFGQIQCLGTVSEYPLIQAVCKEPLRERLLVMGNAAHLLHPVAGQGFNLALREVAALQQNLAEVDLEDRTNLWQALNRYQQQTAWDFTKTRQISHIMQQVFESTWAPLKTLRSSCLTLLNLSKTPKALFTRQMMGMAEPMASLAGMPSGHINQALAMDPTGIHQTKTRIDQNGTDQNVPDGGH